MPCGYEGNPFDEPGLITKLGSINAMIERASTSGEREAAEGARDRILSRLLTLGVDPKTAEKKAKKQRDDAAAPRSRRRPPPGPARQSRPRPRRSYRPPPKRDDFNITDDLSEEAKNVARAIVRLAKKIFGKDTSGGGCRAFYSPEEWNVKEGTDLDDDIIMVVVHDGGDMVNLFNYQYMGMIYPAAETMLKKFHVYAENQSSWYTFIYKEPTKRARPRPAAKAKAKPKPRPRPAAKAKAKPKPRPRPAAPPRAARSKPSSGDPLAGKKKVKKSDLRVGQKVFFRYRSELMTGKITKLNQKTANLVQTNNMKQYDVDAGEEWNISYTELRV